jgi:hypothetical protein
MAAREMNDQELDGRRIRVDLQDGDGGKGGGKGGKGRFLLHKSFN